MWAMRQADGMWQSPASAPSCPRSRAKETGFTGAIGTDQTGFLAGMQGQFSAFEQTLGPRC